MKFSLGDGVVVTLTGAAAAFLIVLFIQDLNAITSRGDEPSLGTITFRKQTATRRSSESQVWERLQNHSAVYQSDTLRTAEDSEAVILFDDGLNLELQQNTMLRLTMKGQARTVDFTEGSVTLSGGGKGSVALGDTGRLLTLSDDALVLVTKTSGTVSLELSQGTASVSDTTGASQALSTERALDVDTATGVATVRAIDLVPRSPAPGARLLDLKGVTVAFAYQVSAAAQAQVNDLRVEVSSSPDFASSVFGGQGTPGKANLALDAGTWYWRVAGKDAHSAVRQFSLTREEPASPLFPADGAEVAYRKKLPAVAFSWTSRELATDWTFELSRTKDFRAPQMRKRTALSSLSVDGLEAGVWYWRVLPRYEATLISPAAEPIMRTLTVTKREAMAPLLPSVPLEGTTVETQELAAKGLAFTWAPMPEAVGYELTARTGSAVAAVAAKFETASPYLLLSPEQLGALTQEGKTFWDLRWKDDEGNLSPAGTPRTLTAVDGRLALRPTYPPEGYQIADQFLTNTRFSWKSNLALSTVFQVSHQSDFSELVYEAPARNGTVLGRAWGRGAFYWRLVSYNPNGSVFLQTEPRRFDVVGPFAPVYALEPRASSTVLLPEGVDSSLSWRPVEGADYYDVSLIGPGAFQARVAQSAELKLPVPLAALPEGRYSVRIQAFRKESAASTSVIGLYGDTAFDYVRLKYPELVVPVDGAVVDGLSAWRQGVSFNWTTTTPAPDARIELRRADGSLVLTKAGAGVATVGPRFPAGDYVWTVLGTREGFDMAAKTSQRFRVNAIPLLAGSSSLSPDGTVFGVSALKAVKSIDLSWDPVPGADEYVVKLSLDDQAPFLEKTLKTPGLSLPKNTLRRGALLWQVEARTRGADGQVEQNGVVAQARFTIDIPAITTPQVPEGSTYYGR